jgi:hypothetical protein
LHAAPFGCEVDDGTGGSIEPAEDGVAVQAVIADAVGEEAPVVADREDAHHGSPEG